MEIDNVWWKKWNGGGYSSSQSKVHLSVRHSDKTLCGAVIPSLKPLYEVEGTPSGTPDCKRCITANKKMELQP